MKMYVFYKTSLFSKKRRQKNHIPAQGACKNSRTRSYARFLTSPQKIHPSIFFAHTPKNPIPFLQLSIHIFCAHSKKSNSIASIAKIFPYPFVFCAADLKIQIPKFLHTSKKSIHPSAWLLVLVFLQAPWPGPWPGQRHHESE